MQSLHINISNVGIQVVRSLFGEVTYNVKIGDEFLWVAFEVGWLHLCILAGFVFGLFLYLLLAYIWYYEDRNKFIQYADNINKMKNIPIW